MNIAIDCRLIGRSGIGTFIENVLEYIVQNEEHHFVLIGNDAFLKKYEDRKNCSIVNSLIKSFTPQEMLQFSVEVVNKCDAFFTPNFNLPLRINVPIYSMIHDIVFFDTPNFGSFLHRLILKFYIKRALKISKHVFTVSEFSRKRIQARFNTSTPIDVIYNGVNKSLIEYANTHTEAKEHSGIIYIGNIKPYKGLRTLWQAYKMLLNDGDAPKLTIVGNIDFRTKDDEMLKELNANRHLINFVSGVSNEELYKMLSEAEVLVSPSQYEGFGLPPLEAMYLGTPAIISDIPVYKEVYHNLPVSYFNVDDSNDLYKQLKSFKQHRVDVRENIIEMYDYKRTASKILQVITQD